MLTPDQARDHAADAVAHALRHGGDAADCVVSSGSSTQVAVRLGAVESIDRSESSDLGLRVFVGTRSASASTADLSPDALDALVERTVAMARAAPDDRYAALAPADALTHGPFADLDTDDRHEVVPAELKMRALAAEDAARSVTGVTNSQGAGASHGTSVSALATSNGFAGVQSGSHHGVSASVLAGEGARMQRDYHYDSRRHLADLDDAALVGTEAGRRAVARLDPVRLKSGPMTIVFDPRTAASLLGHFAGAINGAGIARGTSFLRDKLGARIFAPGVAVIDDPSRPRGMRSRAFDAEGLATRRIALIADGVLTQWIADVASAAQLGIAPTGHAVRGGSGAPRAGTSNLHLAPGSLSPAAIMADVRHGFYVTELIGMGVNGLTGDYSRGASGFEIVDGQCARPVAEVTIAGNLLDMFAALVPANDLDLRRAVDAPTVRVDGMTLAGD